MFVPIDKKDIPGNVRASYRSLINEVTAFMESGISSAEYIVQSGEKPVSKAACFKTVIKRLGLPITLMQREGRIFFVRSDMEG